MKEKIEHVIKTMRLLGIDMITQAESGHPGIVLGAAPMMYSLYANMLNINPTDPNWINRDRFILSAGHGSALLYATNHLAGYDIFLNDLAKFRRGNSITPGHPDYNPNIGVEMTTGALGQGLATAVGIALGERYISSLIAEQIPKQKIIDYYTYVLCSDGDLMEGISYEAACFAAKQKLGKLIVLYDSNDITHDGKKEYSTKEDILTRFKSIGWDTDYIQDGENQTAITRAIQKAKHERFRPTIIEIKTVIGRGSFNQNTNIVHGKPLAKDDVLNIRRNMGIDTNPMEVIEEDKELFQKIINKRVKPIYEKWQKQYASLKETTNPEIIKLINFLENKDISFEFDSSNYNIQEGYQEELRESNSKVMNIISSKTPYFVGGSADLAVSTKTSIYNSMEMAHNIPLGKNIYFGVRENAMGAIINGLSISGLRPYGSTFLAFSDYLKPSIRNAAIMNLPVTYIFTHDGIGDSQDGKTHQAIEQLLTLRTIPNLEVYRPADINEVMGCWESIIKRKKPAVLSISKENIKILKNTNGKSTTYGAYIVKQEETTHQATIVTSGSEVTRVLKIVSEISPNIRVVSMPSIEIFKLTQKEYQSQLIPKHIPSISIEASHPLSYATITDYQLGINNFGSSGTYQEVLETHNFDDLTLKNKIIDLLNTKK